MPYMTIETLLDGFDAYNSVIADVAAEEKVILIDGENEIPGDARHFNDSVHFTDAGSKAMAERVVRRLRQAPALQSLIASRVGGVKSESQPAPDDSKN
jgi:lysophospholipase L1-like esterase